MSSRLTVLVSLVLAPVTMLALTSCGGKSDQDKDHSSPKVADRTGFVPITTKGIAAVVDRHLGDEVKQYYAFKQQANKQLTVGVRLRDADRRDTFVVTVYPRGGSGGEVVPGPCAGPGADNDPLATVTCFPAAGGGNVTITTFKRGFTQGNAAGSYLMASGTGPAEREATASYESFTRKAPISDKQLSALLGDPYLGWETAPKINKAGESLTVGREE